MRRRQHPPTWVSRVLQKQTNVVRFLFEHARTHEPPLLQILPRAFLCYPHIFSSCHVVPPVTIASDVAVLFDLRAFPFLISAIVRTAPPALAMVQAHPDLTTYPCGAKRGEAKRKLGQILCRKAEDQQFVGISHYDIIPRKFCHMPKI